MLLYLTTQKWWAKVNSLCTEQTHDCSPSTCPSAGSVREVQGWKIEPSHNHNQSQSEYKHSLTFRVRRYMHLQYIRHVHMCCHSNETCAPTANPPNSAQIEGTPYHSPSYIRVHAVVWECCKGQTNRQTHRQMAMANIHFALATLQAKCNYKRMSINMSLGDVLHL